MQGFLVRLLAYRVSKKGFEDVRGTLFFDVVCIAKHHKPKLLILENVKNFEKYDGGNTLRIVKSTLETLGYRVFHKVLNASHFGVPQKRERILILAFRSDLGVSNFTFPSSDGRATMVKDFLLPQEETQYLAINRNDITLKEKVAIGQDMFGNYPQKPIRLGIVNKGGQGE